MSNYERIEREIESLEQNPNYKYWISIEDAAQSLRLLLDVARAADTYHKYCEGGHRYQAIDIQREKLWDALTALKEHCDE